MTLELLDFQGRPAWEKSLDVEIPPNRSSRLFEICLSDLLPGGNRTVTFRGSLPKAMPAPDLKIYFLADSY